MDKENTSYRINIEEKKLNFAQEMGFLSESKKENLDKIVKDLNILFERRSLEGFKESYFEKTKNMSSIKKELIHYYKNRGFKVFDYTDKMEISWEKAKSGEALKLKNNYDNYCAIRVKSLFEENINVCNREIKKEAEKGNRSVSFFFAFNDKFYIDKFLKYYKDNGFNISILNKFYYYLNLQMPEFIISW